MCKEGSTNQQTYKNSAAITSSCNQDPDDIASLSHALKMFNWVSVQAFTFPQEGCCLVDAVVKSVCFESCIEIRDMFLDVGA